MPTFLSFQFDFYCMAVQWQLHIPCTSKQKLNGRRIRLGVMDILVASREVPIVLWAKSSSVKKQGHQQVMGTVLSEGIEINYITRKSEYSELS